jgi:glutamate 5-kinase
VDIVGDGGTRVASGIVNYDSVDVDKIRGQRTDRITALLEHVYGDEIVHRSNMVVL